MTVRKLLQDLLNCPNLDVRIFIDTTPHADDPTLFSIESVSIDKMGDVFFDVTRAGKG